PVIRYHADKVAHLIEELVQTVHRLLHVLHCTNSHRIRQARSSRPLLPWNGRGHVGVVPDQVHCVAVGFMIRGQVALEYAQHLKTITNLERQHRIAHLLLLHHPHIVVRCNPARYTIIARHPTTKDDAAQVQFGAQFLAGIVEPLTNAISAYLGIDTYFHTVEVITVGVVARAVTCTGNLRPSVRRKGQLAANTKGGTVAQYLIVLDADKLTFREVVDLADYSGFPVTLNAAGFVGAGRQFNDGRDIAQLCITHDQRSTAGASWHLERPFLAAVKISVSASQL